MVQRSRGSPSTLPRTRIGFRRAGCTHLGPSHVAGHSRRAPEECLRHGRCGDRGGERVRCRYGQRKALPRREPPQSAPPVAISGVELGPNGTKAAERAMLSCEKTWWPGTELNRRRQPFQGCALPPELPGHVPKPAACGLRGCSASAFLWRDQRRTLQKRAGRLIIATVPISLNATPCPPRIRTQSEKRARLKPCSLIDSSVQIRAK